MSFNNGVVPPTNRSESPSGSPRSASVSLQAAAALNAGLQHESSRRRSSSTSLNRNRSSPRTGRRMSAVLMNLQINDPTVPAPGEMVNEQSSRLSQSPQFFSASPLTADPHHHRTPSLGELHQELEAEQEAHVNRLLQMIRQQQAELERLQAARPQGQSAVADDSSAITERSTDTPQPTAGQAPFPVPPPVSASQRHPHPRSSFDMARADLRRHSRTPSLGASPRLRSTSISAESGDMIFGGRDESAFYQAETQMLVRENQMLRHRVRDLEKQLSEMSPSSPVSHEPSLPSSLSRESTSAIEAERATGFAGSQT